MTMDMARKQVQADHEIEFLLSVADVLLLDKNGKQLASATLKTHNMTQSVDSTEIRGGQRNDVLATIKNNKTIEVTIEDVQQQRDFIAMMLGAEVTKGAVDAYVLPQGLTVDASKKVTLPQTPKDSKEVVLSKADGSTITTTFNQNVSAELTGMKEGDIVYVSGYVYSAPAESQKMVISSDKFAGSYKMVLDEQVFNTDMEVIARKQTVFHKVIPNDSFTLDGSAERAEKTTSYTFTVALEQGKTELGYIAYIPVK